MYFKTTHSHLRPACSQYARFITGGKVSHSQGAIHKQSKQRTKEGLPVNRCEEGLLHLNSLCVVAMARGAGCTVPVTSKPTALQDKVLDWLGDTIHPTLGEAQSVR